MSKKNKKTLMFCDIESHGFYGEICLFQYVGLKGEAKVKAYPSPRWLQEFILKHHTVWHNASYDLANINYNVGGSLGIDYDIEDTLYACRTAYPFLDGHGLDKIHDYLELDFYNPNLDKATMGKSFSLAPARKARKATYDQLEYAKADVYTLREIWKQKAIQKVVKKNKAYKIDILSLKYAQVYQMNGIPVDRSLIPVELKKLEDEIAKNKSILCTVNCNSPKQCKEALGSKDTSKGTLVILIAEGNKLAEAIFSQRRLLKASTMLNSWDAEDGRVRTFFNVAGTVTGRFSSAGIKDKVGYVNSQQITRKYQYMFHNTDPNRITFEVDYSTAELRAGCSIMNDATMYKELMKGKDLHIESAKLTGVKNPTREDRQKGKAVSFGLIFSMSAPSFQEYAFENYGVKFSLEEAKAIHRKYHTKYKGISNYQDMCWNNYKTKDFKSAFGRKNRCRLGTDASNYATQSSIAEATKYAIHYLVSNYGEKVLKLIVNVVHDAIYLDTTKKSFPKWEKRLHKAMLMGWKEVCKSDIMHFKDIPMPMETEIIGG